MASQVILDPTQPSVVKVRKFLDNKDGDIYRYRWPKDKQKEPFDTAAMEVIKSFGPDVMIYMQSDEVFTCLCKCVLEEEQLAELDDILNANGRRRRIRLWNGKDHPTLTEQL